MVRRLLAMGQREDRALAILMGACALMFLFSWPRLSREAHLSGADLQPMVGGALLAWIFIMPLAMYALAGVTRLIAKVIGGQGDHFGTRMALFWALLAASPLALLNGLTAGLIGPGLELQMVGGVWFIVFLWFWISGLLEAERP